MSVTGSHRKASWDIEWREAEKKREVAEEAGEWFKHPREQPTGLMGRSLQHVGVFLES